MEEEVAANAEEQNEENEAKPATECVDRTALHESDAASGVRFGTHRYVRTP